MDLQLLTVDNDLKFTSFESLLLKSIAGLEGKALKNGKLDYHKEEFLKQYLSHLISIKTLASGLKLIYKGQENEISALAPACVLIRAGLENYSMFHYIYRASTKLEDIHFKFWSWYREGLMFRQRLRVKRHAETLNDDKQEIEPIFNELSQHPMYDSLSQKQKKNYLKYGTWCIPSKRELLETSGFPSVHSQNLYNHFSSYTHPTSSSQLTTSQADFEMSNRTLNTMLNTIFICSGFYLHHYSILFEDIKKLMTGNEINLIESWCELVNS